MTRNLDTSKLRAFRDRIAGLQTPAFRERQAKLCGAAAMKVVADQFLGSYGPDRKPWEPLKRRRGRPLMKTGRLRASFSAQPVPGGFRIGTNVGYAGYHQDGTRTIPARPMLPESGALPPAWQEALERATNAAVRQQLQGAP